MKARQSFGAKSAVQWTRITRKNTGNALSPVESEISRDFRRSNPAAIVRPRSRHLARDTFQPKTDATRTAVPRTAGGERAGASRTRKNVWVGREAPRQTPKQQQQQQQQQRGVDAKGSRRCGSVAKETRGRNGRKAKESRGVGAFLEPCRSRSPVHGLCRGRRSTRCFSSASRALRSDHGERRAHFPFGDVTGQHGGRRGHASDQRILRERRCF